MDGLECDAPVDLTDVGSIDVKCVISVPEGEYAMLQSRAIMLSPDNSTAVERYFLPWRFVKSEDQVSFL